MSLFAYKIALANGEEISGQRTAKTQELLREYLAKKHDISRWLTIKEVPARKPTATSVKTAEKPSPPSTKTRVATKLERLLYLQSNKCFFCGRTLGKGEASTEHLVPQASGGSNEDGNVVACCVSLNRAFGSMPLKEKIRIILEKAGNFTCPTN